mmetsp:Transcript_7165/g.26845  ORF Transcript_7165/g.26845 Transcript_7165/m.26845 type:complete len:526 (-) Transcript_7165:168-1745(-)|eukprot:CAMPEP_0117449856 /NCGR_PEP_ID=MMETSP0759-20121206/8161_1 /TAXON_ID=63605 /ORGANISM="Percolomonas cosmopolitus, Strain WS" /LENGTH=525 /DNA_ID=CAMNT_0005242345 /DNA_START=109 /DNA_END=1686 /DNA_ORIENTATION=+
MSSVATATTPVVEQQQQQQPQEEPSTTTQPVSADTATASIKQNANTGSDAAENDSQQPKKRRHPQKPRIEFSTLPDTIEGLKKMIKDIQQEQGKKPEFKQREQKVNSIEKTIVKEQEMIAKLRERISAKPTDIGSIEDQKKQVQAEIDELSQKIEALKGQDQKQKERADYARDLVRSLIEAKKTFAQQHFVQGAFTADDVASKLQQLRHELSTKTHSSRKEKELVSDITKLELSQRHVPKLAEYETNIQLAKQKADEAKAKFKNRDEIKALLDERKKKIEKRNDLFQKIKDKRSKKQSDFDSLNEKRDNVKKLIQEKKKIGQEFRQQGDEYYENERKVKACELKIEKLKRDAERAEKQAEWERKKAEREEYKAKMAELARQQQEEEDAERRREQEALLAEKRAEEEYLLRDPHQKEISMLKPLIYYLKNIKTPRGRQKKKPISHPLEKLSLFRPCGVSIPKTPSEVAPIVEQLEKKLADFEKDILGPEIDIAEVRRIRGVEAPKEEKNETEETTKTEEETKTETD